MPPLSWPRRLAVSLLGVWVRLVMRVGRLMLKVWNWAERQTGGSGGPDTA